MNTTITLISNQEDIICNQPHYHPRAGSPATSKIFASTIEARPRSDLSFNEICYVPLKRGRKSVVVAPQDDGSIRIGGPHVDIIAKELGLESPKDLGVSRDEWSRATNEGWPVGKSVNRC